MKQRFSVSLNAEKAEWDAVRALADAQNVTHGEFLLEAVREMHRADMERLTRFFAERVSHKLQTSAQTDDQP